MWPFSSSSGGCSSCGGGGSSGGGGNMGSTQRFPIYNGQQEQVLNQLLNQGRSGINNITNPGRLPQAPNLQGMGQVPGVRPVPGLNELMPLYQGDKWSNYARDQFYGQAIPALQERLNSLGGHGTRQSSAEAPLLQRASGEFENQLADLQRQAGFREKYAQNEQNMGREQFLNNLQQGQTQLGFNRYGLQQNARQNMNENALRKYALMSQNKLARQGQRAGGISSLLQMGLQPRTNTFYQPPAPQQPSAWSQFAGGLGQGLGTLGSLGAAYGFGLFR